MQSGNGFYPPVENSIWFLEKSFRYWVSSVGIVTILLPGRSADCKPAGARRFLYSPCMLSWCGRGELYLISGLVLDDALDIPSITLLPSSWCLALVHRAFCLFCRKQRHSGKFHCTLNCILCQRAYNSHSQTSGTPKSKLRAI
jgi:hypothetical protein